jgi:hypothetical protein
MRCLLAWLLLPAAAFAAEAWSLEKLFTRPFIWGTPPTEIKWSKQGHTLLFLWNAEGNRFRDLYAYRPEKQALIRLTNMEKVRDDLNLTDAEKDERRKRYPMPADGLAQFHMSRDGSRATFVYQGDIYLVATDGKDAPFRLTRTKAAESRQLSPDGGKIAYQRDGQLFVQDLKTGQLWQATDMGEEPVARSLRWSPDGNYFFCCESGCGEAARAAELFGTSRDGAQLRSIACGR